MRYKRASILLVSTIAAAFLVSFFYWKTTQEATPTPVPAQSTGGTKPQAIRILADTNYQPYLAKVAVEFQRQYGVRVDIVTAQPDKLYDLIMKRVDKESSDIDMIQVDSALTPEFAKLGLVEPLNNFVTEELKGNTIPLAYEQRVLNNELYTLPELYAFPMSIEGRFLFYNTDLLRQIGTYAPPSTWKELIDTSAYLRDKNIAEHGVLWGWNETEGLVGDYTLLLNAMGGQYKDVNGKWIYNQGGGLHALQFMVDSVHANPLTDPISLTLNEMAAAEEFAKGRVPFMIAGSYAAHLLKNYSNIRIALIPGFDSGLKSSSVAGGTAMGLVRTSRNKEWSWKFIETMSAKRSDIIVTDYTGALPVWNDMIDLATLKITYPFMDLMKEQFEYAINQPRMASYHSWSDDLKSSLNFALKQKNTPKDALDQAVWRVEKQLLN